MDFQESALSSPAIIYVRIYTLVLSSWAETYPYTSPTIEINKFSKVIYLRVYIQDHASNHIEKKETHSSDGTELEALRAVPAHHFARTVAHNHAPRLFKHGPSRNGEIFETVHLHYE